MSSTAVACVRHLIDEYRRFLRSTYRLADPDLRKQFENHIDEADVLVKGPYVTLARDFVRSKTLADLEREEVGHADLLKLHWAFGAQRLFAHQEKAFRRIEKDKRNSVVKTGTGSGKTEAFLLPVISGVLKMRQEGVQGTKAILLYPMNALANDQLERIRNIVRNSGVGLTFAMYTGDSETVATMIGEPVEGNELIARAKIRATPPDIILTNFKQLEYLLIRRDDRPLFTPSMRYLVLDEIHSYRGALATEIACLIRRLKSRCGLNESQLRCIGTSATVSEGAGGDEALAEFVTDLFGEPFNKDNIIGEDVLPRKVHAVTYKPPLAKIEPRELEDFPIEDEIKVLELAHRITGREVPQQGSVTSKIAKMFDGNAIVSVLEDACVHPFSLSELVDKVRAKYPEAASESDNTVRTLLEAYLLAGSIGKEEDPPILRPKLHTFFHGVYDVGLCMNPDCRTLVRDGSDQCPRCQSAVRPAALCRTCGQDFVKVRFPQDESKPPVPNDSFQSDDDTGFITPKVHVESAEEDEENGEGEETEGVAKRRAKSRDRLVNKWVCHHCGMVHDEKPEKCRHCGSLDSVTQQKVLRGRGNTCPACNSTYTKGDILTLLRSGVASTNSMLATHHLDRLTDSDRKLIMFADNRQEAAHQAGYMGDRHRQFALRHAIEALVRSLGNDGSSIVDLPQRLVTKFQEIGLISLRLGQDDRKKWLKTLEIEAAGEFCRSTHQRISLENLALVEVQYEFLSDVISDAAFIEACKKAGISRDSGAVLARAMLDRMRRNRAVSFDFFQRYIDPDREPWSLLQPEPWSVTFPEYERNPVFFMFDRSEAARNKPGGFTFQGITRDGKGRGTGALLVMAKRVIGDDTRVDEWMRSLFKLLQDYELLTTPQVLPPRVRNAIGTGKPLQISTSVIRLIPAQKGYRCQRCQVWRPYRGPACFGTKCMGGLGDLKDSNADKDNYYVRLYTSQSPGRIRVAEHTAQIDQEQRAKREQEFKTGKMDVLVCSPTLELGVDIGPLLTVLMRNAPPAPANYVQRAGRAGRRLRIGFVSTFCGMGSHDRHSFEDPPWLLRGQFFPPTVRLDNGLVVARHIRSFALENITHEFPGLMGELVDDLDHPKALELKEVRPLLDEIAQKQGELVEGAARTFIANSNFKVEFITDVVAGMPAEIERILKNWFELIQRIYNEFDQYRKITADRRAKQKAAARERAYRELTTDRQMAYTLTYMATEGLLPSYQFPMDTFSLDPGVNDTPTLRRPAWIALFEFAPGNLVYANGHKLKSIRAFFEGRNRTATGAKEGALEASGRVRAYCFCARCGYAAEEIRNQCPDCGEALSDPLSVAFIESFEAEQSTQITSAEEGRERSYFERKEHLIADADSAFEVFPYPFIHPELCSRARVLVTNWGKRPSYDAQGERFELCPSCGKHRPATITDKKRQKWDEDHAKICSGHVSAYVLGYEFKADALVLPIPGRLVPRDKDTGMEAFARSLGSALVSGAVELIEIEPDEVAFFYHPTAAGGLEIVFYETVPGGAGYLRSLAERLNEWADMSLKRLVNHECAGACYKCLKSYRNQPFHKLLDKHLIQDVLFQLSCGAPLGPAATARRGDGVKQSDKWIEQNAPVPKKNTVIERKLLETIRQKGRLPDPVAQREFRDEIGLITIADFAYEAEKIAIYCDGFMYHGSKERLASDAQKRNNLQAEGWAVLTFWGQSILKFPERCEEQIWRTYQSRRKTT